MQRTPGAHGRRGPMRWRRRIISVPNAGRNIALARRDYVAGVADMPVPVRWARHKGLAGATLRVVSHRPRRYVGIVTSRPAWYLPRRRLARRRRMTYERRTSNLAHLCGTRRPMPASRPVRRSGGRAARVASMPSPSWGIRAWCHTPTTSEQPAGAPPARSRTSNPRGSSSIRGHRRPSCRRN
jgi:hypothetical protein